MNRVRAGILVLAVLLTFIGINISRPTSVRADLLPDACLQNSQSSACVKAQSERQCHYRGNPAGLTEKEFNTNLCTGETNKTYYLGLGLKSTFFAERYLANLVIELVVAFFFVVYVLKRPLKILSSVAVANILSYPIFYYFATKLITDNFYTSAQSTAVLAVGEVCVFVFETLVIYYFCRYVLHRQMSLKQALALSAVTNISTILISLTLI